MKRPDARAIHSIWTACREAGLNVFAPGVASKLDRIPGWSSFGIPGGEEGRGALLESVRALELLAREAPGTESVVNLVISNPAPGWQFASTRDVARTLIQGARKELMVLGYAISDAELRDHLIRRGSQGVKVTVVSDRTQTGARELLRCWPAGASPLTALQGVEPERGKEWIVHGKVIVSDREVALVGSANFTVSGLGRNLEVGVQFGGKRAAEICDLIDRLARTGWLVPAPP